MINSDEDLPELKPRVFDADGNPVAFWSDEFQSSLESHPEIKKRYEKLLKKQETKI